MFKESSSPVKASSLNPLSPDLLTLYRRLNPIKIWPTYAVPPTTTLYPRSTYDLWRAGSSPTIFQPVEKLIPLTTTSQSGPDQSPLYFRPTYALPDQGPLIADLSIFPERERAGVDRVSGVNGPINSGTKYFAALTSASFISLFRVVLSLFQGNKTEGKRWRYSLSRSDKTKTDVQRMKKNYKKLLSVGRPFVKVKDVAAAINWIWKFIIHNNKKKKKKKKKKDKSNICVF